MRTSDSEPSKPGWGEKAWFEQQFSSNKHDGDAWGHRWRGSQKYRYQVILDFLEKNIPTDKGGRALDIGCAEGDFTEKFARNYPGYEIYGSDIAEKAVERISGRLPKGYFKAGGLPDVVFDEKFDLVMTISVMEYLSDKERQLSLKQIDSRMNQDAYYLFFGVLSKKGRYFREGEVIKLIKDEFNIISIDFYRMRYFYQLESIILKFYKIYSELKEISELSGNPGLSRNKSIARFLIKVPIIRQILLGLSLALSVVSRFILEIKYIPQVFDKLSSWIIPNMSKTGIIILSQKK